MKTRVIRRNMAHAININCDQKDELVTEFNGKPTFCSTEARTMAIQKSKKDKSSYYGTEVYHPGVQSWVNRTLYYNGYAVSGRG